MTDDLQGLAARRRWIVVAPTIYPLGKQGYAGIERLVVLFLRGLLEQRKSAGAAVSSRSWELGCVCANGSVVPRGTTRYSAGPALMDFREPNLMAAVIVSIWLADASVWLDFSHSKPVGRSNLDLPHLSPIWHDPALMQPQAPWRNVVALSEWQAERFRRIQKQECLVLDPICGDANYFNLGGKADGLSYSEVAPFDLHGTPGSLLLGRGDGRTLGERGREEEGVVAAERQEYLLFIGKLAPDKGCLEAIQACRQLKQRLEIVGPVTPGDPPDYVAEVLRQCDGQDIVYHGEVTEAHKLTLLQRAKALLYPVSYPPGFGEAHSHKAAEAMLCGLPCIAYDQGAMDHVIDQGVTGLVIPGRAELAEAIKACETIDRAACRARAVERWHYQNVVARWLPVMEEVSRGARW